MNQDSALFPEADLITIPRPRPGRDQTTTTMRDADRLASNAFGSDQERIPMLQQLPDNAVKNPRTGLRRWVIRSNPYSSDPQELIDWGLVELHHDGSIAVAIGLDGSIRGAETARVNGDLSYIPYRLVDAVIADAVALAVAHVRALGGVGTILTRAALLRDATADRVPLVAIDNRLGGGQALSSLYHQVQGSRAVRRPVPIEAAFSAEDDVAALRKAARELPDDLDQQFGIPTRPSRTDPALGLGQSESLRQRHVRPRGISMRSQRAGGPARQHDVDGPLDSNRPLDDRRTLPQMPKRRGLAAARSADTASSTAWPRYRRTPSIQSCIGSVPWTGYPPCRSRS